MRQQDSRIFAELLNRVREGHHSQDDLDLLRTRTTSPNTPDYPSSVQHLFRTNAQVAQHFRFSAVNTTEIHHSVN